jgi:hypothetical protein
MNERVRVALSRGEVVIPWDSRQELLKKIRHLDSARPIVIAFEAVGISRPVTLRRDQKVVLLELIELWGTPTHGGLHGLPEGIVELRNALRDDLRDSPQHVQSRPGTGDEHLDPPSA